MHFVRVNVTFYDAVNIIHDVITKANLFPYTANLIISVYLSSLPVAHLSNAPRRRLVVTGDSARIQDEITENSAWFFNVLGV